MKSTENVYIRVRVSLNASYQSELIPFSTLSMLISCRCRCAASRGSVISAAKLLSAALDRWISDFLRNLVWGLINQSGSFLSTIV
jgi:hypothetical protein